MALVDERDEVGRFVRVTRPVRRGEAIIVEDAMLASPADDCELQALLSAMCCPSACSARAAECGVDSSVSSPSSWLPVLERLSLVAANAVLEDPDSEVSVELGLLHGDEVRWAEPAGRLWTLLREELRVQLSCGAFCEVYAAVAENALLDETGSRAGLFRLGSYLEHSCSPSAFKELLVVQDVPSTPSKGQPAVVGPRFQLVVRALQDLDEGDSVSISYIDEYLPTYRRRELLQARYNFFCSCHRCELGTEAVAAYVCPACGGGPCSPEVPLAAPLGVAPPPPAHDISCSDPSAPSSGLSLRCDNCSVDLDADDAHLQRYIEAEHSEAITPEVQQFLHPFHYKIHSAYSAGLLSMEPTSRIQALELLLDAQRRLSGSSAHPLLGRYCELMAAAHMELHDHQRASAKLRAAQDFYSQSHRGPPDAGHGARCRAALAQVTTGPLGTPPRRQGRAGSQILTHSPSLRSFPEGEWETD
eukprot:TRINITY_DN26990_c0_g1_i1.p1 TRINITY_DN26990_c0_g1~~TRINITY_DN26990_c0_g1_i1.p1  ORF type:complete len:527 (+),score=90.41 TRINITY_DN26990_c0_g1_i1:160-1581(+)